MTKLEKFIAANPTDPRVVRLLKMMNKPLSAHSSRCGRLVGELMMEAEYAF